MQNAQAAEVRSYLAVFGALLVLTTVTVGVSYLQLPPAPTVALGLSIALVKASLVAMCFMHLKHERAAIHWTLVLTAVLLCALVAFTLWSEADHVFGSRRGLAVGD